MRLAPLSHSHHCDCDCLGDYPVLIRDRLQPETTIFLTHMMVICLGLTR